MSSRTIAPSPPKLRKTPSTSLWLNFLRYWQLYVIMAIPLLYIIIFHYVVLHTKRCMITGIWRLPRQ
jgi:hypothetical protein